MDDLLFHLALDRDWSAGAAGDYTVSTLGVSLEEQGFIHCSFAHQVQRIADLVYRGREDVVLLEIDLQRVTSPVQVDAADDGDSFPHIYGPLNRDAVVRVTPVPARVDGRLDLSAAGL